MNTRRALLALGGYYLATGLAPFVSRRAFEAVTGPKQDWWLVETVGGVVTAVGAGAVVAASRGAPSPEILVAAGGSAVALAAIDIVYVAKRRIAPVYLVDAGVELGLLAALVGANSSRRRLRRA